MKKFMWIPALLTVLVLMVTGCPGTGDAVETPTGGDQAAANWYLSATEGGAAVANNTITVAAVTNVYIYFDPLGKDFDTIAFDFTATPGVNLTVTAIYGMFDGSTCTWGKQDWDTNWYESGPLTIDTTAFTADWSGTGAGSIDKTTVKGFCINIAAAAETTFTLNGVTFAGTGSGTGGGQVTPPPTGSSDIKISFQGVQKTGSVTTSDLVTVTGNTITAGWDSSDQGGAFRVKVTLAADQQVDLSSGYTKFVMDWSSGAAAGGNFNITFYFSGNRLLSNWVQSGTAEFNFASDNPDWASGWGDAALGTVTGFEIFSDDSASFGSGNLVISGISFE